VTLTVLTVVGMAALAAPVVKGTVSGRMVRAQIQPFVRWESLPVGGLMAPQTLLQSKAASMPQFDVASIKLGGASAPQHGRLTRMEALIETSPGLLAARNATLKELVEGAYSLEKYQVMGGQEWIESVRFEVLGKAAGVANRQQLLLMLQPLLAERFRLTFHRATKEMAVYALVVAKGAKLKTYQGAEGAPLGVNRLGRNVNMADFAKYLTRLGNDLPVIDKTGLTGNYDLDLDMNKIMAAAGAESGNPGIAGVFQATVDAIEGLGLRLVRTKAPIEVLVVDHAERPSGN
jgi:uncharacterized protein (TIGR03435 family)